MERKEDIKNLDEHDKRFAIRLKDRDTSVLTDIDRVFRGPILALLQQSLQLQDAEMVFNLVLENLWEDFDADKGSVRGFLSVAAKRRMVDLLRKKESQRKLVAKILENAVDIDLHHPRQPDGALVSREEQAATRLMLREVMKAFAKLTHPQQKAFNARFLNNPESKWAKKLEEETRIPAKRWRKHSDSALNRVRQIVANSIQKEAS